MISKDELMYLLRENLELNVETDSETGMITVEVKFDGEIISSAFFYRDFA